MSCWIDIVEAHGTARRRLLVRCAAALASLLLGCLGVGCGAHTRKIAMPAAPLRAAQRCAGTMSDIEGAFVTLGTSYAADSVVVRFSPLRRVRVDGFCLDRHEVTVAEYWRCLEAGACTMPGPTSPTADLSTLLVHGGPHRPTGSSPPYRQSPFECRHIIALDRLKKPVTCVSHSQAQQYCLFRGGRLPTQDEWEYAARGRDERIYPWGNDAPDATDIGTGDDVDVDQVETHPGDRSPFGIFDMASNVREWTSTAYDTSDYAVCGQTVFGARAELDYGVSASRAAYAYLVAPSDSASESIGFRCASAPKE